jgi:hypothetical protein
MARWAIPSCIAAGPIEASHGAHQAGLARARWAEQHVHHAALDPH